MLNGIDAMPSLTTQQDIDFKFFSFTGCSFKQRGLKENHFSWSKRLASLDAQYYTNLIQNKVTIVQRLEAKCVVQNSIKSTKKS